MSDNIQIVMRLDPLSAPERGRLATDLTAWLQHLGVISPEPLEDVGYLDAVMWAPGERWREVVDIGSGGPFEDLHDNGVTITAEVGMQSALGNYEDPTCGRCGVALPSDERFGELIETWLDAGEPSVACSACGWTALLGDWPTRFPPGLVGAPALGFRNWFPLRAGFVDELITRLGGGRCRYFWEHS